MVSVGASESADDSSFAAKLTSVIVRGLSVSLLMVLVQKDMAGSVVEGNVVGGQE